MKLSKDGKGILYITIFLTIFGIIMVLSSSWPTAVSEHRAWYYYGLRQGIFALLGFIFMKFTSVFNNENYKKNALWIFAFSIFFVSFEINSLATCGSINIPPFTIEFKAVIIRIGVAEIP